MPGPSIAIALFPGVEELDWVGPWEVLSGWARRWPDDGASVFTVADTHDVITCSQGARVLADCTWEDAPPFDLLVWPGGPGIWPLLDDEAVRARLRRAAAADVILASVCTGSLLLADAGVLDGRPATSYWASLDHLVTLGTGIEVRPHDRYVDDGNVVTASGVSAGIDMALHLVRRFHSEERAREVRRFIQYDPEPPV
ncbi:MAG: DJ-1/PfpI family protein [Actinomycetota bacterium]|jgi:transcriptional regulator GlxA family with amidase domain|nr:DJ-1/PfpI family protein [Actinomycetota bacterium]PLS74967.1 MAG: DJ-1/PfpI family protein [Actinomycetota bacterium]